QLVDIRKCIADLVLPTWVERPPVNLGEKSHGTLKAAVWLTLFVVVFPLKLLEFWAKPQATQREKLLLDNFYELVAATNIVASFTTSNADADAYQQHYLKYCRGLQSLFSSSHSVPNHHYAMHNPDMLKFWGPLPPLSEFAYERFDHVLQSVKTNRHLGNDKRNNPFRDFPRFLVRIV
ncbi:hypothetical protein AURDEDRAFT_47799, partial [Auricularia subglabra TFB-10046 SS5]